MTVIEDDCVSVAPVAMENEERDEVVSFSYSHGLEMKHTLSDDPHAFVGWEVHGEWSGPVKSISISICHLFIITCFGHL